MRTGNTTSHTGTATTPLLYGGQYQDVETGFYYLRSRYYDPATGQFLTVDPAVAATQAPYFYSSDSPLNSTDPTGLDSVGTCGSTDGSRFDECTPANTSLSDANCGGSGWGWLGDAWHWAANRLRGDLPDI